MNSDSPEGVLSVRGHERKLEGRVRRTCRQIHDLGRGAQSQKAAAPALGPRLRGQLGLLTDRVLEGVPPLRGHGSG